MEGKLFEQQLLLLRITWVELQSESSCLPLGHLQDQESQEYLTGKNNESKNRISIRLRRLTLCITFVT